MDDTESEGEVSLGDLNSQFERKIDSGVRLGLEQPSPEDVLFLQVWSLREQVRETVELGRARVLREQDSLLKSQIHILKDASHAPKLAERHNSLLISPQFIAVMELLAGGLQAMDAVRNLFANDQRMLARLQRVKTASDIDVFVQDLHKIAEKYGFFVSHYSPEYEEKRLMDPNFLIVETDIPNNGKNDRIAIADCQICIPETNVTEPVFELPNPELGDRNFEPHFVDYIRDHPSSFAVVEDITCAAQYNNSGYAGITRNKGFHVISTQLNPERGEAHQIKFAGAAIAMLLGIRRPDGTEVLLQNLPGLPKPVKNERSLQAHTHSRHEARLSYFLNNRLLPFTVGGQQYQIVVGWLMHFLSLTPRAKK